MERISFARSEFEVIEVYGSLDFFVQAADIDNEFVVNEHPYIVVAVEFKVLSFDIDKFCLDLHGEAVIVVTRSVFSTAKGIVVGVFNGLGAIEPAEVV